jgi:hypothetical protein
MRKIKKRKLLGIFFLFGLLVWLGSSAFVAWRFTRRSSPPVPEPPPAVSWAKVEGHRLSTSDKQQIGAWLVRGKPEKGCVLLLHGNGCSRGAMLPVMEMLAKADYTVLAITLRAHGDSTGEVNDLGWSARNDVAAAVDFLQREFSGRPIFVVGRSLGSAAAVFAAKDLAGRVAGISWNSLTKTCGAPCGIGCNAICLPCWIGSPTAACACGRPSFCPSLSSGCRRRNAFRTSPRRSRS